MFIFYTSVKMFTFYTDITSYGKSLFSMFFFITFLKCDAEKYYVYFYDTYIYE